MTVAHGSAFTDQGANRTDNVDGSDHIVAVSGSVNTSVVGTYILTYTYTDLGGNPSNIATRTVYVTDQTPPVVTLV